MDFSEVDWLGVEIGFFDFCVGSHHEVLAPERNREHSIGDQVVTLEKQQQCTKGSGAHGAPCGSSAHTDLCGGGM